MRRILYVQTLGDYRYNIDYTWMTSFFIGQQQNKIPSYKHQIVFNFYL